MASAINAAEKAVFDALDSGTPQWPVFQHVPQDTPPPLNIIGDISSSGFGTKTDDDARLNVQILSVYQGENRKSVVDEQERIASVLDEQTLSVNGFNVTLYLTNARAELMDDGETYIGTSSFNVLALRA